MHRPTPTSFPAGFSTAVPVERFPMRALLSLDCQLLRHAATRMAVSSPAHRAPFICSAFTPTMGYPRSSRRQSPLPGPCAYPIPAMRLVTSPCSPGGATNLFQHGPLQSSWETSMWSQLHVERTSPAVAISAWVQLAPSSAAVQISRSEITK